MDIEMKVYEIGLPSHYDSNDNDECCDCTLWIATSNTIKLISKDKKVYITDISEILKNKNNEMKDIPLELLGVDFIIE